MDPVSQGALGAVLPQSVGSKLAFKERAIAITWLGCFAGMAPDIDVFIRSSTDPLLFLEFHRQFTHSLFFIPFGALICAAVFFRWAKKTLSFKLTYLVCLLGYSTHALLDACTTYGTQLFWPLTDERVAWNTIAVVDPFATVPLLIFVILAARRANPRYAQIGLAWFLLYLSAGWLQKSRADNAAESLAESRGHIGAIVDAKPGFANLLLWKSVYEYNNHYYVDGLRMGVNVLVYPGTSTRKLDVKTDLPWLDLTSQQATDVERFRWFSMNHLALDTELENYIIDVRYSVMPNEIKPLWGVKLDSNANTSHHVEFIANRDTSGPRLLQLWKMITGEACIHTGSERNSSFTICDT